MALENRTIVHSNPEPIPPYTEEPIEETSIGATCNSLLSELTGLFLGRQSQIEILLALMGEV